MVLLQTCDRDLSQQTASLELGCRGCRLRVAVKVSCGAAVVLHSHHIAVVKETECCGRPVCPFEWPGCPSDAPLVQCLVAC